MFIGKTDAKAETPILWSPLAHQAPLSVEFFRQKYWGGLLFTPGNLPDPEIEPESPESSALAGEFFTTKPHGKPNPEWDFLKKINQLI